MPAEPTVLTGLRRDLTKELFEELSPNNIPTKESMQKKMRGLIETVKHREERDNITVAIFRAKS